MQVAREFGPDLPSVTTRGRRGSCLQSVLDATATNNLRFAKILAPNNHHHSKASPLSGWMGEAVPTAKGSSGAVMIGIACLRNAVLPDCYHLLVAVIRVVPPHRRRRT